MMQVVSGAVSEFIKVVTAPLIMSIRSVAGWSAGTSMNAEDTVNFRVLTSIRAMSETRPLEIAAAAYDHMMSGKARFRVVLTMP